ncbi:hypothetical protein BXZ70DRAFT_689879 [Cristinia sonorae]|uniref:Uncharacterized protein n=1 Tax=Cristinia sonorae TaxID=1940300 RepID=A0A8K0XK11_9AGAR|nr:hypothetical protein BXZ70DRAFT_689879 [Cristinia sonorae]
MSTAPLTRGTVSPEPLPSLPPSPTEEDIGGAARAWHEESTSSGTSGSTLAGSMVGASSSRSKGVNKGKGRELSPYSDDAESSDEEANGAAEGYPPTKDEVAESRRIEENLRRWEMAERQRRKAARESQQSAVTNTSVVGGVTRTASLLWTSRRNKRPSMDGAGSHHVLQQSGDDNVALEDLDNRLIPSPRPDQSQNPFRTPNASTTSLNTPYDSAVMTASSSGSAPPRSDDDDHDDPESTPTKSRTSVPRPHPPPAPLDLPKPRTPPPRADGNTSHASRPPEPIPPPVPESPMPPVGEEEVVSVEKTRWWTDWLCGCVEKGDHQAARTNPFE